MSFTHLLRKPLMTFCCLEDDVWSHNQRIKVLPWSGLSLPLPNDYYCLICADSQDWSALHFTETGGLFSPLHSLCLSCWLVCHSLQNLLSHWGFLWLLLAMFCVWLKRGDNLWYKKQHFWRSIVKGLGHLRPWRREWLLFSWLTNHVISALGV